MNSYKIIYFGLLAERRGLHEELVSSAAENTKTLYQELNRLHQLGLEIRNFRVAVNDEFVTWEHPLQHGDGVAFLPPMSGG